MEEYQDDDLLRASAVAQIVSRNSRTQVRATNIAALCRRQGIMRHKVDGGYAYRYGDVKHLVSSRKLHSGRPRVPHPLSNAEKQRRFRERRKALRSSSPG